MRAPSAHHHLVARCKLLIGATVVDVVWRQVCDATVTVLVVVPGEELAAEADCVVDADEFAGER